LASRPKASARRYLTSGLIVRLVFAYIMLRILLAFFVSEVHIFLEP
jgi:hypothetical protein